MSSGEEERNRLKEEYKDHYRKIRDLKQKLAETERAKRLSAAIEQINPRGVLDQFDDALNKVREKIFAAEARLDVAMENADTETAEATEKAEQFQRQQNADETIRQMKAELGLLNDAVEAEAARLPQDKTLGKRPNLENTEGNPLQPNTSRKSLGRKSTDQE